jgi:hypothetical protein
MSAIATLTNSFVKAVAGGKQKFTIQEKFFQDIDNLPNMP